jgi:hypothetical protein
MSTSPLLAAVSAATTRVSIWVRACVGALETFTGAHCEHRRAENDTARAHARYELPAAPLCVTRPAVAWLAATSEAVRGRSQRR